VSPSTYSIGIDLGTTYTAAAVYRDGAATTCLLGSRGATIPSLVFLRDDQVVLTGEAAERRGVVEPTRLAREFKRRVGDSAPIMLGQAPYSAERLMAALLHDVVAAVATREGGDPAHVAVSHPANWGPFKVDLLSHALDLAGLRSVTLLTEPVAAAVHYASKERIEPGSVVAVYDLGGGTFDAAVLRKTDGGFETLGEPEGIERLGGIDFDEAVFAYVRTELAGKLEELDGNDPSARVAVARLRRECVAAKEALSADSDTAIPVALPNAHTDIRISRAELEPMIRPAIAETIEALRRAIERSGVRSDDLDAVLLVGGSSQIPLVAQMVSSALGRPVAADAHPKNAVAMGAAVVAARQAAAAPLSAPSSAPAPVGAPPGPTGAAGAAGAAGAGTPPTDAPAGVGGPGSGPSPSLPGAGRVAPPAPGAGTPGPAGSSPQRGPAPVPTPSPAVAPIAGAAPPAPAGRWRSALVAGAATAVLSLVGVGWSLTAGGDGGAQADEATGGPAPSTTAVGDAPDPSTTATTAPAGPACGSASGRCAVIGGLTVDGDRYVATYDVEAFDPVIFDDAHGTPDDHHVHFFFDTTPPEHAGTNSATPGQWVVWDRARGDGELRFDDATVAAAEEAGARQLCVRVADAGHGVEPDSGNCTDLPR
jgi:actin-like ATPase involved in cell morphogenesis